MNSVRPPAGMDLGMIRFNLFIPNHQGVPERVTYPELRVLLANQAFIQRPNANSAGPPDYCWLERIVEDPQPQPVESEEEDDVYSDGMDYPSPYGPLGTCDNCDEPATVDLIGVQFCSNCAESQLPDRD